jgi:hypothetical protein
MTSRGFIGVGADSEALLPSDQVGQSPKFSAVDDDWPGKARIRVMLPPKIHMLDTPPYRCRSCLEFKKISASVGAPAAMVEVEGWGISIVRPFV